MATISGGFFFTISRKEKVEAAWRFRIGETDTNGGENIALGSEGLSKRPADSPQQPPSRAEKLGLKLMKIQPPMLQNQDGSSIWSEEYLNKVGV